MPRRKKRTKKSRRKSAKRVKRGKALAKKLPRDAKGKFLPLGSKNLFRKRKRRRSAPATKRRKQPIKRAKLTRRKSVPNMSRRGRTKDDFPNFLSGIVTLSAANIFTTQQIFTPIPRLKTIGNKATVMELLYMDLVVDNIDLIAVDDRLRFQMHLGTAQGSFLTWSDTRVFVNYDLLVGGANGTPGALVMTTYPWRYQFQTQDGFGYLLASDSFRISGETAGMANAVNFHFKLYYRFVDIPLSEFIGIVQSTQAT